MEQAATPRPTAPGPGFWLLSCFAVPVLGGATFVLLLYLGASGWLAFGLAYLPAGALLRLIPQVSRLENGRWPWVVLGLVIGTFLGFVLGGLALVIGVIAACGNNCVS